MASIIRYLAATVLFLAGLWGTLAAGLAVSGGHHGPTPAFLLFGILLGALAVGLLLASYFLTRRLRGEPIFRWAVYIGLALGTVRSLFQASFVLIFGSDSFEFAEIWLIVAGEAALFTAYFLPLTWFHRKQARRQRPVG